MSINLKDLKDISDTESLNLDFGKDEDKDEEIKLMETVWDKLKPSLDSLSNVDDEIEMTICL